MVKNGCGQSGQRTLKLLVSQKLTDRINYFLHTGANSRKLKVDSINFAWVQSKMAMAL